MQQLTRSRTLAILILLCALSVGLIVVTDNLAVQFLEANAPSLKWLGQIRIVSFSLCLALYIFARTQVAPEPLTTPHWKRTLSTMFVWLTLTGFFVLVKKVWVPSLPRWVDVVAFMGPGLLAEEFLFRGCIYEFARKVFPQTTFGKYTAAALISSFFFGLQHIGYHHFQWTLPAATQIVYTFMMGMVFASVRESSGRLWPVILLHILTNVFTLLRQ